LWPSLHPTFRFLFFQNGFPGYLQKGHAVFYPYHNTASAENPFHLVNKRSRGAKFLRFGFVHLAASDDKMQKKTLLAIANRVVAAE